MPAKGKKGKEVEVPETPAEVEVPAVVEPPNPWDRYDEIWTHPSFEQQRLAVSDIFNLPNGPPHSLQAITLDTSYQHLLLTHEQGLNVEQAKRFYDIMMTLQAKLGETSLADAFALFKETLMQNSILIAPPPKREEVKVVVVEEEVDPKRSASRGSKRGGTGKKSAKGAPEETPEPVTPRAPPKPLLEYRFEQEHIRAMTEYAAGGIFGHYLLHRAVFDSASFTPRKFIHTEAVSVKAVVPDLLALSEAVDVDEEDAALAEGRRIEAEEAEAKRLAELVDVGVDVDPESTVGKLVESYIRNARTQMEATLANNEKHLDSKFDDLAQRLKSK